MKKKTKKTIKKHSVKKENPFPILVEVVEGIVSHLQSDLGAVDAEDLTHKLDHIHSLLKK